MYVSKTMTITIVEEDIILLEPNNLNLAKGQTVNQF